jgi:hypothetical protein
MWTSGRVVMAGAALFLVTAGGAAGARPSPPAELLAILSCGPPEAYGNLRAFAIESGVVDTVPAGDLLVRSTLAQRVGVRSLDGVEFTSGLHLLIADLDGTPSAALLAKVSDARLLANGLTAGQAMIGAGWAAIGSEPLLDRIGRYALDTIAAQPITAAFTVTVYLPQVLAHPGSRFRDLGGALMTAAALSWGARGAQLVGGGLDWMGALAADVDQLVVVLDATPDTGSLDITLRPRSGSTLATFVAMQRPADYALLERLPTAAAPLVLAGTLDGGPYRGSYLALLGAAYGASVSRPGLNAVERMSKANSGKFAIALQLEPGTGWRSAGLFGLSDPDAAGKALSHLLDFKERTFDAAGMSMTFKRRPGSAMHDGVILRGYDATLSFPKQLPSVRGQLEELVPVQFGTQFATFDAIEVMVVASDSLAEARRVIDAARGKTHFTAAPLLARLLQASRARNDSAAVIFDPGVALAELTGHATPSQPMLITFGFTDHKVHARVELQPVTLRTLVRGEP